MRSSTLIITFSVCCFYLMVNGCQREVKQNESYQDKIFTDAIHYLSENEYPNLENRNYLVSPYIRKFEFNNFTKEKFRNLSKYQGLGKKAEVLEDLKMSDMDLRKIQDSLSKFLFDEKRIKYSTSKNSNLILMYSFIDDKLFFLDVFQMKNNYNKSEIQFDTPFKDEVREFSSFVILLKEGEIKKVFVDNSASWL